MKIKTSELKGAALDWAVAKCEESHIIIEDFLIGRESSNGDYRYSEDWNQGGPIMQREGISPSLRYSGSIDTWDAIVKPEHYSSGRFQSGIHTEVIASGTTMLIAGMRCWVRAKLGDEVEVPDELAN